MCGIAGYIGRKPVEGARIGATLEAMKNRGPDHRDHCVFRQGETWIVLLHSRLAIIDLDARSNQPFTVDDCTVVFNGEIYNYVELRKELEQEGVVFRTDSDTEVLVRSYIRYGEDCVRRFEGMWSFALYDGRTGRLLLSRDRFAEKPLYWMERPEGIYFGSEVKFLKALSGHDPEVNLRHLWRYLALGYKSLYKNGETFYREVREIPFATNVTIRPDLQRHRTAYWSPSGRGVRPMTRDDAVEGARHHLKESMRIRLRADVPMVFCLSGGVDSAALVSIAAKEFQYDVHTFSIIESDERYNEYDNIMATIRDTGCRHTLIHLSQEPVLPKLRQLIAYHDSPVATISYYIHSLLSEAIAAAGYRVAFSGTSADELFTGYYDHYLLHLSEMRRRPDYDTFLGGWAEHVARHVRNPLLKNPDLYAQDPSFREHVYDRSAEFRGYLLTEFDEPFREEHYSDSLLRNRMLNELFHEATPVILHEDDLNSMHRSIENRSPYLDSRLFDFAYSIPGEYLIRDGYNKWVLRESVKGILNEQVRTDRQKKGFNASIYSLVNFDDPQTREELLAENRIYDYVDRRKIERLFRVKPTENSYSKFLFSFINASMFLEANGGCAS